MIEVKLEEDFGGEFTFANRSDAIIWCQKQRLGWIKQFYEGDPAGFLQSDAVNPNVRAVAEAWGELEYTFTGSDHKRVVVDTGHPSWSGFRRLMTSSSPAAGALSWINKKFHNSAVNGAFLIAGIASVDPDWTDVGTTIGAFHYQRIIDTNKSFEIKEGIRGDTRKLDMLHNNLELASKKLISIESKLEEQISSADDFLKRSELSITNLYDAYTADAQQSFHQNAVQMTARYAELDGAIGAVERARDKGIEDLDRHRAAYREEHLLQPAAKLWKDRAEEHHKSAYWSGWLASGAGVVGSIATVGIFLILRSVSEGRFAATVPNGADAKLQEEIARASLHYELAFSGAGTLLCLTMFLWLMRVLVRRYTTHRRLAVDAAGRQALTLTYIGLIAEGAVNEKERPIVLASLFLPVTDNSVDDGPPATSLASILAAIAAGKSGAA